MNARLAYLCESCHAIFEGQRDGQVPARPPGRVLAFAFVRYGQRRRE